MNFPKSLSFNSGCPFRQNPTYFQSLLQASREHCPAQISDPDMFITFHSPHSQEAQSPVDLGGLSPRSEDSLERTIKKLKLNEPNIEESPEYRGIQNETQSIFSDFQPWSNFQFEVSQGVSTLEGETASVEPGSSLSGNVPQCPMLEMMRGFAENGGEKKPVEEQEDDDDEVIFLESKPSNQNQVNENKASQCPRHQLLGKGGETMKVHKGAKTIHEVTMLGEHEKMLWQSFVKVHSHIPGFPVNQVEHLDYITMILRHKAKHLFSIGKQQVNGLSKTGPEANQVENTMTKPIDTVPTQINGGSSTPEDPRQVFNDPYHKKLLEKCPVMHDFFKKENPQNTNTTPAPASANHMQNPHTFPGNSTTLPNPHMRPPQLPQPQTFMPCNPVINDRNHAIQLLNSWFGMGYNHLIKAQGQNNPAGSGCPMRRLFGGAEKPQAPGRERRGAFKAALTKMKNGSNRK